MYKIVGKFFDEDIERECNSPDYAIGVFAAGKFSIGIFSAGLFSIGIFSIGIFNVGLYAIGFFIIAWKKRYAKFLKQEN